MIKTHTVFVLGAGASVPYCFPTSAQLTAKIRDSIQNPKSSLITSDFEMVTGIKISTARDMASALKEMPNISIDEWLARNIEYIECGKLCIAREIMAMEGAPPIKGGDWISDLWVTYLLPECEKPSDIVNTSSITKCNT